MAYLSHWLGRHPDGRKRSHGQHLGEPGSVHPIGMGSAVEALEVHGIGEKDPIDVRRKHIMHFKAASGYLEGHPARAIQLGKQLRHPLGVLGEAEVPFFVSGSFLRLPLIAVDIPGMQIQADVPRYHGLPPSLVSWSAGQCLRGTDLGGLLRGGVHGAAAPPERGARPGSAPAAAGPAAEARAAVPGAEVGAIRKDARGD